MTTLQARVPKHEVRNRLKWNEVRALTMRATFRGNRRERFVVGLASPQFRLTFGHSGSPTGYNIYVWK
jgi:hypothetical protein